MPASSTPGQPRYALIDALRALACLAVVLFHAREGGHIPALLAALPAWVGTAFLHGESGVAVFFVISGFVIAHSMMRDHVDGAYAGRFMLRRSLRLDPPYWAAIALALLSAWLSARMVPGKVFDMPSAGNLLLHMTYLVDLAGAPKINSVYWTLCLEIQFYLSFVLLMWLATAWGRNIGLDRARNHVLVAAALMGLLWVTPLAPFHVQGLFLQHWHLFLVGVLARRSLDAATPSAGRWCLLYIAALTLACSAWHASFATFAGLATGVLLLAGAHQGFLVRWSGGAVLQWIGLISYSLYLTHNTVTGALFRAGYKLTGRTAWTEGLWLVLVTIGCCVFAWLFYLVFERAGLRWSKQVGLHRTGPVVPSVPAHQR